MRNVYPLVTLKDIFLFILILKPLTVRYIWHSFLQALNNKTTPFDNTNGWLSDSYLALGILGFLLFVLLGITSLPSVSNNVNWREFRFVQVRKRFSQKKKNTFSVGNFPILL